MDGSDTAAEALGTLLVADSDEFGLGEQALADVGVSRSVRIGWAEIDTATFDGISIAAVEADGVDEAALAAGLAHLKAAFEDNRLQIIVALDESQIDLITAHLLGANVQLLCSPTRADWVAALAVAREMAGRAPTHDPLREDEAARLARLNEEVARIAEVLARLSRRDEAPKPGDVAEQQRAFHSQPADDPAPFDPRIVRDAIRARRMRDRYFGDGLLEDPAWDMLLDLFAAHLERGEVSVSSLCIAAAVAPTTALRWIGRMTDAGLFLRQPDPFDRRRALMTLSPTALEKMRAYFMAVQAQGLSAA